MLIKLPTAIDSSISDSIINRQSSDMSIKGRFGITHEELTRPMCAASKLNAPYNRCPERPQIPCEWCKLLSVRCSSLREFLRKLIGASIVAKSVRMQTGLYIMLFAQLDNINARRLISVPRE